jgi:hypothetical protein
MEWSLLHFEELVLVEAGVYCPILPEKLLSVEYFAKNLCGLLERREPPVELAAVDREFHLCLCQPLRDLSVILKLQDQLLKLLAAGLNLLQAVIQVS